MPDELSRYIHDFIRPCLWRKGSYIHQHSLFFKYELSREIRRGSMLRILNNVIFLREFLSIL